MILWMSHTFLHPHCLSRLGYVVPEEDLGGEIGTMTGCHDDIRCNQGPGATPLVVGADGYAVEELSFLYRRSTDNPEPAKSSARQLARVGEISRIFIDPEALGWLL